MMTKATFQLFAPCCSTGLPLCPLPSFLPLPFFAFIVYCCLPSALLHWPCLTTRRPQAAEFFWLDCRLLLFLSRFCCFSNPYWQLPGRESSAALSQGGAEC